MRQSQDARRPRLRPRAVHAAALVVALAVVAATSACRPQNPPNALSAMLRAVPTREGSRPPSYLFTDFSQARKDLGIPRSAPADSYPLLLRDALARVEATVPELGALYRTDELEALLELYSVGESTSTMLVGDFDSATAVKELDSRGWPRTTSGLFQLFRTPQGGGLGIGPRRIVHSTDYAAAEEITAFRGGENSLLGLPGSGSLAVSAGRATAFAGIPEPGGCLDPLWLAVGVRYLRDLPPLAVLVVRYEESAAAEASRARLDVTMREVLRGAGHDVRAAETRGESVLVSIASHEEGAAGLVRMAMQPLTLEAALQC